MTIGLPLPLGSDAVEIGFELLNSTCAELFCGEGVSTLGDADGSTDGSTDGLALATGAGCWGWRNSCWRGLALEIVVFEFSSAGRRDIAK